MGFEYIKSLSLFQFTVFFTKYMLIRRMLAGKKINLARCAVDAIQST